MKKSKVLVWGIVLVIALIAVAVVALIKIGRPVSTASILKSQQAASASAEFSADQTITMGKSSIKGKLYYKRGDKLYSVYPGGAGADEKARIWRRDLGLKWSLHKSTKTYSEGKFETTDAIMDTSTFGPIQNEDMKTYNHLGTQTINGYLCDKYRFSGKVHDPTGGTLKIRRVIWISRKLGVTLKDQMENPGSKTLSLVQFELKNIKEGPQPGSLFEVPAGYTKQN